MRLLDTYATNTGSIIDSPFIFTKYFPLPNEQYITLQSQTPYDSRNYAYWQEVIDIINPYLLKNNIKIIHTGLKDDRKYNGVIDYLGQTNINQLAYIIKNSILHFGSDSFGVHLASYYDKPIVALYSISNPNVAGPHFGDKSKHILIKAYENIGNKKPSYSPTELPKSINTVKPEEIAKSILKLLNIQNELNFETIFIGNRYSNYIFECLPKDILGQQVFQNQHINIRFDYIDQIQDEDYNGLFNNLNIRPCSIITDKFINLQPFLQLKDRIVNIIYNVTKEIDMNFISALQHFGGKVHIIFEINKSNEKTLEDRKFDLIDMPYIIEIIDNKAPKIFEDDLKDVNYKSSKLFISNNEIYLSRSAFLENKPIKNFTPDKYQSLKDINNIQLFLEEDSEFCLLFK